MGWMWVNDLLAKSHKKKAHNWDPRCPYHMCPSNQPYRGAGKPRLKFMQKIGMMVYQYKCKDCGCLTNFDIAAPGERGMKGIDPALWGGNPSYRFFQ